MERNHVIIVAAGAVVTCALRPLDIFYSLIAAVITFALFMSIIIMEKTSAAPQITCFLSEDARALVVINQGTAPAEKIHVVLVPQDIEFEIPSLNVDARHECTLPNMINEAKAVVTYEHQDGKTFSHTFRLSALSVDNDDLLKPVFPMFGWK